MEALSFVSIIEKDKHDSITTTWVYPSYPDGYQQVLINRGQFHGTIQTPLVFSRFGGLWHYTYTFTVGTDSLDEIDTSMLRFSNVVSITVASKHFFPERYFPVTKLFAQMLLDGKGKPIDILDATLSLASRGTITFHDQEVTPPTFDEEKKSLLKTPLTDVTSIFGVQSVYIWHAMLTRRFVLLKSDDLQELLNLIRAFPLFVFHRQDWSILRPFITTHEKELKDCLRGDDFIDFDDLPTHVGSQVAAAEKGDPSTPTKSDSDSLPLSAYPTSATEQSPQTPTASSTASPVSFSSSSSPKSAPHRVLTATGQLKRPHSGVVCGSCDPAVDGLMDWDFIADIPTRHIIVRTPSEQRDDDSETPLQGPVVEITPFHREAADIIRNATSQKDLITGLTNLTLKITSLVEDVKKELGDSPFTPKNVMSTQEDTSLATCRFLVDVYQAELQ